MTAIVAACLAVGPAWALDPQPGYERYSQTTFLPYLNATGAQLQRPPALGLSFGGGRVHRAILDSGSTGIVVGATSILDFERLPKIADGQLTYTSSGRIMLGQWVLTPLVLHGADGTRIQTEPMPVLAVTQVQCLRRARNCAPREDVRHIGMIGIGFARERDRQAQSTPDKNPLLRILDGGAGGERRSGYVLTSRGIHVGLTADNTAGEFRYIKLDRQHPERSMRGDWSAVPACISIERAAPPSCGTMLVDTGVADMFMTTSPAQAGAARGSFALGTEVTILAGSGSDPAELYSFRVGDASPAAPRSIHLRVSRSRSFVNTSFHILNAFDFLYDADGGYAGFRRR
jgi:hypothetical protein